MQRRFTIFVIGLVILCLGLSVVSALLNARRARSSTIVDRLSLAEKARASEVFHLRQTLGDAAWPGLAQANIPLILYNESYAFLIGLSEPEPGWVKVPQDIARGGAWEPVPGESIVGQPYYRLRLPNGVTPEAFTVKVGEEWVASLATLEWLQISLANQIEANLPAPVDEVFPYGLATRLLVPGAAGHIATITHEAFHAFQGQEAPQRLTAAELSTAAAEAYPVDDQAFRDAWQQELDLLADAVEASSDAETARLAREFLDSRTTRRRQMDADLIAYERQREWLEGLAKYVELAIWQAAATTPAYEPAAALQDDPEFDGYDGFDQRWNQEVDQIRRMAGNDGDGRFYYSGWAQAVILDRLLPGWKTEALADGVFLEDLLQSALEQPAE